MHVMVGMDLISRAKCCLPRLNGHLAMSIFRLQRETWPAQALQIAHQEAKKKKKKCKHVSTLSRTRYDDMIPQHCVTHGNTM